MSVSGARLRPGAAAEAWLDATLAGLKPGGDLHPATVITPSNYAGLALRHRLASRGFVNVRHSILARLAESVGAPRLAAAGRLPLTAVTQEAAIRAALRDAGGLGRLSDHRAVIVTLRALFADLSQGEVGGQQRQGLAAGGELTRVAIEAYEAYRHILERESLYDPVDLLHAATEAVGSGTGASVLADWGGLCLYLPGRLSSAELGFLNALAGKVELIAGFPQLEDSIADAEPRRWAAALGLDWEALPTFGPAGDARNLRVLVAPDAGEEVRAAARMLLADLEANAVPLHRTAIVYRNQEPYQQLVRETLDAAGLPWAGLGGKPISESFAGRALLGLLHLQGEGFSRASVINWLSSLPHGGSGPSLAQWDRVSREAGVVRGVRQWRDRLNLLIDQNSRKLADFDERADDSTLALRNHLRSEVEAARRMLDRVAEMERETRPPPAAGWPELVAWARALRERFAHNRAWPADQLEAAQLVDETLDSLTAAAQLDAEVGVDRFVETLEEALRARRRPEGRLGHGVVTGPIALVAGMEFDRLYVLGMTERAYPTAAPVDPIFPWDTGEDPLGRAEHRLAEERMAYLSALAASGGAVLCFPTHDTEQRPAYPARWLLEATAELAGTRVSPSALREPGPELLGQPWLTGFVSAEAALRRSPVSLNTAELRVREALELTSSRVDLRRSALALRPDLPIGRGLQAAGERASTGFTEYDGNLAAVAADLKKLAGGLARTVPISPSGVETWAACPFRYFLGRVLEIEPTERPEDQQSWTISPIDRGSLIHGILEEFFRKLHEAARPGPAEAFTEADRELIHAIAQRRFREVEELGQTGYQLAWQNTQAAILLDLETVLTRDQEFRLENAVRPEHFEQGFGFAEGWPAAEVALSDGTVVRLRGYIDRVDVGDSAAYVTDYKTGSAYDEREFLADPVVAGTKVQLAVYSNAVRRHLEAAGRPVGQVTASYWFISEKGHFERVAVTEGPESNGRLAQVMEIVNQGLGAGAFPQVPGEEQYMPGRPPFANCRFCDYHRVCPIGRDQIHDRKQAAPGADIPARLVLR